jgi:hypothetical protein
VTDSKRKSLGEGLTMKLEQDKENAFVQIQPLNKTTICENKVSQIEVAVSSNSFKLGNSDKSASKKKVNSTLQI